MHIIHLRGPWQVEAIARFVPQADGTYLSVEENLPPAARATMPADWSAAFGGDFLGRVRYSRAFHRPTGLEAGEHVFLVVEPARSRGVVELNGKRVGEVRWGFEALRVDVTELMVGDEKLEIVVEHDSPAGAGGLIGEVRLEIED
jgi:beta-galactosidase/beta-glucuronidase